MSHFLCTSCLILEGHPLLFSWVDCLPGSFGFNECQGTKGTGLGLGLGLGLVLGLGLGARLHGRWSFGTGVKFAETSLLLWQEFQNLTLVSHKPPPGSQLFFNFSLL